MLTIFVGPKKEIVQTTDGNLMRVYPMLVKEGGQLVHMQKSTDYRDIKEVELFVVLRPLPFVAFKKKLTAELQKAIVDFLHFSHAKGTSFSCWNFACLYCGTHTSSELPRGWRNLWQVRRRLFKRAGDVVFLTNRDPKRFHAAVYLGWGRYLSVYGVGGDLEVSTLRDMHRDFETSQIFNVVPCR